mgnify:CR=1 FL=1
MGGEGGGGRDLIFRVVGGVVVGIEVFATASESSEPPQIAYLATMARRDGDSEMRDERYMPRRV